MAPVDCRNGCRNDHDDDADDMLDDPLAVADLEHSDALRAAVDGGDSSLRNLRHPQRHLHRIAEVRRLQGVTLRNVSRRLGAPLAAVRRQEQPDCDLRLSDLLQWQEVLETMSEQANSCPSESLVSILTATYNDDQKKSHDSNYIELSMQAQFNKRAL